MLPMSVLSSSDHEDDFPLLNLAIELSKSDSSKVSQQQSLDVKYISIPHKVYCELFLF